MCSFGLWLLGLYLLLTLGADNKAFAPDAVGWYSIALIIPVAIDVWLPESWNGNFQGVGGAVYECGPVY